MDGNGRWNGGYETWRRRRVSRRTALRGAAVGGVGIAAAATIGCGDDDDDDDDDASGTPGGAASPGAGQQGQPKVGGTLRVRQAGDPPNLSLLRASALTAGYANHVYSSLLRMRSGPDVPPNQWEVEPDLASAMPEQPDELTYVFKLRPGVQWQNVAPTEGRPLTSEEVKLSIDAYRAETSPFASDWALIDTVEATDASTVTVRMKEPYAPFINLSAGHYGFRIFPPELLEGDRMATEAVGTGPWMLDSYEQGNRAVYKKNPTYFRQGEPYLDELVFLIVPTDASAVAAFRAGELDVTGISCIDAEDLKRTNSDAQFEDMLGLGGYIALNTTKEPYNDIRVRRALSMALNREAESQALYCGDAQPDQLLPIGAYDRALRIEDLGEAARYWEYNPEGARELLTEAGYGDGFTANARFTPVYGQTYQSALERAIGDFKEVGLTVEPESIEYGQWISSVYRGQYDFNDLLWGFIRVYSDPEPFLWFWLHPEGITNQSRVNDPEITELLVKQRSILDVDERWEVLADIQRMAADKMYYIGRTTAVTNFVWAPWVRGFRPQIGYDSLEYSGAWDDRA